MEYYVRFSELDGDKLVYQLDNNGLYFWDIDEWRYLGELSKPISAHPGFVRINPKTYKHPLFAKEQFYAELLGD